MQTDRPQAPGYLANLMARLFHEVAGAGLAPLGIRPQQFPILVELWFGQADVTVTSLVRSQEMRARDVEALLLDLAADGLIAMVPAHPGQKIVLTERAVAARDDALKAARRANQAAAGALTDTEMAQLLELMNRVIDALQKERAASSE
jgi:DNA-binding MarR family transcriptional regulator